MSMGPLGGLAASISAAPLLQAKGTEPVRAGQELVAARRRRRSDDLAETAAGIAPPDGEDHQSSGRSGSGRPAWEYASEQPAAPTTDGSRPAEPPVDDTASQNGRLLDLRG